MRCYSEYLHHDWKKIEFQSSEMLQNEVFMRSHNEYTHHGWRKIWLLEHWNSPEYMRSQCEYIYHGWRKFWDPELLNTSEWKYFFWDLIVNTFTKVEENFKFWSSEMLQNEGFSWEIIVNIFTMVEENLELYELWNAPE